DHLGRLGADDVRAEDFAVRLADDELHKAFALADCARLAARHERELADLEFLPRLLRRALGETNARDLRLAIRASGESRDFLRPELRIEHPLHRLHGLEARDMREPRRPDNVACSKDA